MDNGINEEKLIQEIREWLREENIHNARYDGDMILKFLAGCKYQTSKVKMKMKNFYEMRKSSPELFNRRDPLLKNLEDLLSLGAFFPLPKKDAQGHTLIVVKAGANNPATIPMTDVFKVGIMSVDLLLELDKGVATPGVIVIIELTGVGLQHALQMTPTLIRQIVHLWQGCYPIRIQGIHFTNCPLGADTIINIFRRFLAENLRARIHTHGSQHNSLYFFIPPNLLPEEYGGELGPTTVFINEWKRKVLAYRQWFLQDDTLV